jgi:hypothetical protein
MAIPLLQRGVGFCSDSQRYADGFADTNGSFLSVDYPGGKYTRLNGANNAGSKASA